MTFVMLAIARSCAWRSPWRMCPVAPFPTRTAPASVSGGGPASATAAPAKIDATTAARAVKPAVHDSKPILSPWVWSSGTGSPDEIRGVERSLEIRVGSLGGIELRPTRLFVWKGEERAGNEQLVPIGERPAGLDYPRHETNVKAGRRLGSHDREPAR